MPRLLACGLLLSTILAGCATRTLRVPSDIAVDDPAFPATIAGITGREFTNGNTVEYLTGGPETFARLFEMIDNARHSINIESYIYNTDTTGDLFADRLIARAQAGVKVNLLVDAVGGFYFEDSTMDRLRAGGVRVFLFNTWNHLDPYEYRVRTHRRVVVVDGTRGMVGGFAITDWWREPYHYNKYPVFDLQAYVEGPTVRQLQSIFVENWRQVADEVLTGPRYFPAELPGARHPHSYAMISSSAPPREIPKESTSTIYEVYLFASASARRS